MKTLLNVWIAVLLCFPALAPARDAKVSAADARAIRQVIEKQLEAFAADDSERAFALAAPSIRRMFGSPARFMAMVQHGYPVVYRPASVTFLNPEVIEGEHVQMLQMTDAAGATWIAVYHMQRQVDKSWRIGGVELAEGRSRAI